MWLEWRCCIWMSFCTPLPHPWLRALRSFICCTIGFFTILTLSEWFCYLFCVCVSVIQLCLTLCDPMNCSLPSSSVHGILLSIILESIAISSSRGSSWSRNWTHVSCTSCFKYSLPRVQPGKSDAIKTQIKSCLSFAQNHVMIHCFIGIKTRVFMIVCNLNLI